MPGPKGIRQHANIIHIFIYNYLGNGIRITVVRDRKMVIFNRWRHMTCLGRTALIIGEKQPLPTSRGLDSTVWKGALVHTVMANAGQRTQSRRSALRSVRLMAECYLISSEPGGHRNDFMSLGLLQGTHYGLGYLPANQKFLSVRVNTI